MKISCVTRAQEYPKPEKGLSNLLFVFPSMSDWIHQRETCFRRCLQTDQKKLRRAQRIISGGSIERLHGRLHQRNEFS